MKTNNLRIQLFKIKNLGCKLLLAAVLHGAMIAVNAQSDSVNNKMSSPNLGKNPEDELSQKSHIGNVPLEPNFNQSDKTIQEKKDQNNSQLQNTTKNTNRNSEVEINRNSKSENIKQQNQDNNLSNHPDGIMMKGGKMYFINMTRVTEIKYTMHMNGILVMSNGLVTKKDGSTIQLKEGEYLDKSGNRISVLDKNRK